MDATESAVGGAAPAREATQVVRPGGRDVSGEPIVELTPGGLRVTGPGRRERGYRDRIRDLELEVCEREDTLSRSESELEVAALVERGTARLAERIERQLEHDREELRETRRQGHRMMVALGALTRENEELRQELAQARDELARIAAAPPPSLWRRLVGGRQRV